MKHEAGFTLLEVLISLTIMAVGVALTLSLISGSIGKVRKVRTNTHLIEKAQSAMETVLLDSAITGAETRSDTFEDGTRWVLTVSEVEMPPPPSAVPAAIAAQAPKVLSYEVVVTDKDAEEYQLRTLKLINPPTAAVQGTAGR